MADFHYAQERPNLFWKSLYWIGDLAVFRPIKDTFGFSKARISYTTGASLSPDAFRFFRALGISLKQMYGITEAGTAFSHRADDVKFETIGSVLPDVEVRISDEGEILIASGAIFKGYYKNPDATREKLIGKWFHTGDAGYFTDEGQVVFLDRVSDLRELAGGGKYAPSFIEGRLRFSPYIKDAMCIGGKGHHYVTAILIIDFDILGRWAEEHHIPYTTYADLSQKPEIYELTQKEVERVSAALPTFARVRRYSHLHKEFDPDEAELTRTRKLRRAFMEERYRGLIEALYGNSNEIVLEAEVKYRDGRTGVVTTPVKIISLE